MSAITQATNVIGIKKFADENPVISEATRLAQYSLVDEMPGLIFGLMTLVYIVTSLYSLA